MRRFYWFLVWAIGFSVIWFSKEIFGGRILCFMDLTHYFYPVRLYMVESVRRLSFPFWNPYVYFGFPFLPLCSTGFFIR